MFISNLSHIKNQVFEEYAIKVLNNIHINKVIFNIDFIHKGNNHIWGMNPLASLAYLYA